MNNPSRFLGIDFGARRIGIAVSDPMGLFAQPLEVLENKGRDKSLSHIKSLAERYSTNVLVLGHPRNMDGSLGEAAAGVEDFAQHLRALGLEVILWDERLTTAQADRMLIEEANMRREKRKESRDKIAASLILQSYLEHKKSS